MQRQLFTEWNTKGYLYISVKIPWGGGSRGPALIIGHGPRETLIRP